MLRCLRLFWEFFKISLFVVGGGYAIIVVADDVFGRRLKMLEEGELLGIVGSNGAGKSTLLKILSRVTAPTEGDVWIDGRVASMLEVGTGFHGERPSIYHNLVYLRHRMI